MKITQVTFESTIPTPTQYENIKTGISYAIESDEDVTSAKEHYYDFVASVAQEKGATNSSLAKK